MAWQRKFLGVSKVGDQQSLLGLALRLVDMLLGLVPVVLGWWAIFTIHKGEASDDFWLIIVGVLAASLILQLAASYGGQWLCFSGGYHIVLAYRKRAANHLRKLPLGYFSGQRMGETTALMTDDVKKAEDFFTHFLADLILHIILGAVLLVAMLALDLKLGLAVICLVPLGTIVLLKFVKAFARMHSQQLGRYKDLAARLVEFALGAETLRVFHRFAFITEPLLAKVQTIKNASMPIERTGGIGVQVFRLTTELGLAVLFAVSASALAEATPEEAPRWILLLLVAYFFTHTLVEATLFYAIGKMTDSSGERLVALMAEPPFSLADPAAGKTSPSPSTNHNPPAIEVANVSFSYPGSDFGLGDVSLTIPEGSVTAIVGPSGSGKSTLLGIISGFYKPLAGQVNLGGVPYAELGAEGIYEQLGVVFQDSFVFAGTIADNIRLGKTDATMAEVEAACQAALCHDFISQLPDGYATPIGEDGLRLSGGERQRLAIARMMVKNPKIILVDEMTAQLDPINQHDAQRALSRLARGKTVAMVAHRLHTTKTADQIAVMDAGRLVQLGGHEELLAQDGLYKQLWSIQDLGG